MYAALVLAAALQLDTTTWILGPGEWITRTWAGLPPGTPESPWAAVFGFLFWVAVVVALALAWSYRRNVTQWVRRAGQGQVNLPVGTARVGRTLVSKVHVLSATAISWRAAWSWPDAWNVLWRAQVVHLVLFIALPLVTWLAKAAFVVVLLPFSVMGFGNGESTLRSLEPLRRPMCWTFLSYCPSPAATFGVYTPPEESCRPGAECGKRVVLHSDPAKVYFKLAWLVLSMGWVGRWRRGQMRGVSAKRPGDSSP
jgi:hypothetical protein